MGERILENSDVPLTQEDFDNLSDDELVARFVEIADRGVVDIRTNVKLPSDMFGHWVRNTPEDVQAARMNGFEIDGKFAVNSTVHSDGKGSPVVGDIIFMTCSRRIKDAHDKAAAIQFRRVHGVATGLQEEKDFEGNIKSVGLGDKYRGAKINTSINERVSASDITSMIKAQTGE